MKLRPVDTQDMKIRYREAHVISRPTPEPVKRAAQISEFAYSNRPDRYSKWDHQTEKGVIKYKKSEQE